MLIDESGLVRAVKSAYKHGGYTVANQGETVAIYTESWFIRCRRAMLPRKAMAAIVEHTGMIPNEKNPVYIQKYQETQVVMEDVAQADMDRWIAGQRGGDVTMVPVIMQGCQIFQVTDGGPCWGVPVSYLNIIERAVAEHSSAEVVDKERLLWLDDGETVALGAVRKAMSGWAREWERAVWNALESVDLHKEEV